LRGQAEGNRPKSRRQADGYLVEETVGTVAEIVPWLQEAIAHFYPESSYARSLSPELSAPSSDSSSRRRSVPK
jgi:hypothetical protein